MKTPEEKRKANLESAKKYRNSEKYRITHEKYYNIHKKELNEYRLKWDKENPEYHSSYHKEYYEKNKERINKNTKRRHIENREEDLEKARQKRLRIKFTLLSAYGGKCECCGEDNWQFLTLDHINNDGAEQRKKFGKAEKFYRYLIRENFPKDIRILCWNCNCSRGMYGYCPHELQKE